MSPVEMGPNEKSRYRGPPPILIILIGIENAFQIFFRLT